MNVTFRHGRRDHAQPVRQRLYESLSRIEEWTTVVQAAVAVQYIETERSTLQLNLDRHYLSYAVRPTLFAGHCHSLMQSPLAWVPSSAMTCWVAVCGSATQNVCKLYCKRVIGRNHPHPRTRSFLSVGDLQKNMSLQRPGLPRIIH